MTFTNNVLYMVKTLTFYMTMTRNFYHVIKRLLTLAVKLHDLLWTLYDTYEGWKSKSSYLQQG